MAVWTTKFRHLLSFAICSVMLAQACNRPSSFMQAICQLAHAAPSSDACAAVRGDADVHNGAAACSVVGSIQQRRSLLQPVRMCEPACGRCRLSLSPH
jgi:hypothetical protein